MEGGAPIQLVVDLKAFRSGEFEHSGISVPMVTSSLHLSDHPEAYLSLTVIVPSVSYIDQCMSISVHISTHLLIQLSLT